MNKWGKGGLAAWVMMGASCVGMGADLALVKTDEYIGLDAHSVKLLFKAPQGSDITVRYGLEPTQLGFTASTSAYDRQQGLVLSNLSPNSTYFYQVTAHVQPQSIQSPTHSLTTWPASSAPQNAPWAQTAVFYQVFVRSFFDSNGDGVGDFKGLQSKLDYIKSLGIDALWLLPIMESPSEHGFDVTNYYQTEPDYGNLAEFEQLIQAAHARGLKVIIDLVVNHSSSAHPWFAQSKADPHHPYRNYYVWQDAYTDLSESGPWEQVAWQQNIQGVEGNYWAVFVPSMPDLNLRNPLLRHEIKQIAQFWLDKGVDGFRLDAALHIDDSDPQVTLGWWREFNQWVKSQYPDAFLVGEVWVRNPKTIAPFMSVMDSAFDFGFQRDVANLLSGKKVKLLARVQKVQALYRAQKADAINSTFLSNHDMDRISAEVGWKKARVKQAASLLLTLPGAPFIYYGDELGQRGKDNLVRAPFDWYAANQGDGQTSWLRTSFNKPHDGISLEEQWQDEQSVFRHYQRLIQIRKQNPVLFQGQVNVLDSHTPTLLAYQVFDKNSQVWVFHNLSETAQSITVPAQARVELYQGVTVAPAQVISLLPHTVAILR